MDPEKHNLFEIKATKRRGEERLTQRNTREIKKPTRMKFEAANNIIALKRKACLVFGLQNNQQCEADQSHHHRLV